MKKIMGLDYGDARTGVAISDLLCSIVGSTTVIPSRNREKAIADIVRLVKENQVGEIVVGLPRNMDGSEGDRAKACRDFAMSLEKMLENIPVELCDERSSTVLAHTYLNIADVRGKKRKKTVDAVAAVIILESYLSFRKNSGKANNEI